MHNIYYVTMDLKLHTKKLFSSLGLPQEFGTIYFSLLRFGPQSLSELSRTTRIERTKLYRLLPDLQRQQIIEIEIRPHRKVIKAAPLENISLAIESTKARTAVASKTLEDIVAVAQADTVFSPTTRVRMYQGKEGLKQMLWNQTRAKKVIHAVLLEDMRNYVDPEFFERWIERCNENQLQIKSVISSHFLETRETRKTIYKKLNSWSYVEAPKDFPIKHNTVIYDKTTSYFNWHNHDVYGVEIVNEDVANTQRYFVDILLKQKSL